MDIRILFVSSRERESAPDDMMRRGRSGLEVLDEKGFELLVENGKGGEGVGGLVGRKGRDAGWPMGGSSPELRKGRQVCLSGD